MRPPGASFLTWYFFYTTLLCCFFNIPRKPSSVFFFFFNDTATTEIYTLSLHDALPIWTAHGHRRAAVPRHRRGAHCAPGTYSIGEHRKHGQCRRGWPDRGADSCAAVQRSEEHTSELQSPDHLVCRLLLEKKKHS